MKTLMLVLKDKCVWEVKIGDDLDRLADDWVRAYGNYDWTSTVEVRDRNNHKTLDIYICDEFTTIFMEIAEDVRLDDVLIGHLHMRAN